MPNLWFVSDPARTPDPEAIVRTLPRGAGVIYRGFGAADALATARRLRSLTRRRGLVLLIGADARLAARVGADGVHLPQRLTRLTPGLRARHPDWLITAAAHDAAALARAGAARVDAAILSVVFPSASASAGPAIGPARLAVRARAAKVPVIALGGINDRTAPRLVGTGAWGLAAVAGFGQGRADARLRI